MKKYQKGIIGSPTIILIVIIGILSLGLWYQNVQLDTKTTANGKLTEKLNQAEHAAEVLGEQAKSLTEATKLKDKQILILQEEKTELAKNRAVVEQKFETAKNKLPRTLTVTQVVPETPEEIQQSQMRIDTAWAFYCSLDPTFQECQPPVEVKEKK